jgi:hypothetical protein
MRIAKAARESCRQISARTSRTSNSSTDIQVRHGGIARTSLRIAPTSSKTMPDKISLAICRMNSSRRQNQAVLEYAMWEKGKELARSFKRELTWACVLYRQN